MKVQTAQFIAIILTAVALVPGGAHLLEFLNKINLERDAYTTAQSLYRGWALLGIILIAATASNLLLSIRLRSQKWPAALAAVAAILLLANLTIFFTWTFPANRATNNWTVLSGNWETLRTQWEYSHAVNAVLTFIALCSTAASSLVWAR